MNSKEFPSYESFYSSLKSKNTLEPAEDEPLTKEEISFISRIPNDKNKLTTLEIEQIAHFRYRNIRDMFNFNGWSMKEYLEHYNNLDTFPFIQSLANFCKYYIERGCDIFKEAISGELCSKIFFKFILIAYLIGIV